MALYPLLSVTALPTDEPPYEPKPEEFELEATYQMMENKEPNPEIQRLIQSSLGQSAGGLQEKRSTSVSAGGQASPTKLDSDKLKACQHRAYCRVIA